MLFDLVRREGCRMFSRKKATSQAEKVRETAQQLADDTCSGLHEVAGRSCGWIKANPWAAVGAGALVGLLAGVLLTGNKGE